MTLNEIKEAVRGGNMVYWKNRAYQVKLNTLATGAEQWSIVYYHNGYTIGLTWRDGVTLNGEESDFFIDNNHQNCMTEVP